ncbi:acetyl-CoA carboxylase biotin carboxylase subunit family protein [Streptomyces venezuelae]|uniref:ATP-grasp domain-containing protein n=1 Tax=Streptomyces venezuelae TaxID=54571 RepID=UPI003656634D
MTSPRALRVDFSVEILMKLLVFCSPDTPEAVRALYGHEVFLVLDIHQSLNGLRPTSVLMLDFMQKQDLNAVLEHMPDVVEFAREMQRKHGPIDRVVSFNEATNYAAAELREELSVPGDTRAVAELYRDKWAMYETFTRAGLRTPETRRLTRSSTVTALEGMRESVVLKPRDQAASRGVRIVERDAFTPDMVPEGPRGELLAQDCIEGEYYHFDVAFRDGTPVFCGVNRYLYHGLDWASGEAPMASVTEHRADRLGKAHHLVRAIGEAFDVGSRVLHIEAFWVAADDDFTLIELADRPGGALIVPAHEAAGGPNLEAECIRSQLPDVRPAHTGDPVVPAPHCWIVTPLPGFGPYVVEGDNRDELSLLTEPVVQIVPEAGELLHDRYRYRNPSGKFVFLGEKAATDARHVAESFRLDVAAIDTRVSGYWKN